MNNRIQKKVWPVMLIVLILLATAWQLHRQGRLWSCGCRSFFWTSNAWSSLTSQTFFDPYSFTHLMHGFVFAGILLLLFRYGVKQNVSTQWRLAVALIAEALWEILENSNAVIDRYRSTTAFLGYHGDTVLNSMGDILCCGVGVLVARKLGWLRSLPIFLATEVLLLFWIRDSLVLELIMLLHPIDGIKTWQLGH